MGDGPSVMKALSRYTKTVLDVAERIGTTIAAKAIVESNKSLGFFRTEIRSRQPCAEIVPALSSWELLFRGQSRARLRLLADRLLRPGNERSRLRSFQAAEVDPGGVRTRKSASTNGTGAIHLDRIGRSSEHLILFPAAADVGQSAPRDSMARPDATLRGARPLHKSCAEYLRP